MVFRELQKGVTRRFSSLKNSSALAHEVRAIIATLYSKRKVPVKIFEIVYHPGRKRLYLHIDKRDLLRLEKDREMIRAALRGEGLDIRTIVVEER